MQGADGFFKIFSLPVRRILQKANLNFGELQEIRMRINSPLMMQKLFEHLKDQGLTERQIEKLAYKNALRIIREVLG